MRYFLLALLALACGKGSDSLTGVDLTDPSQLVGSYHLAVYKATPGGENPGGSLTLRADSTFSLSVNVSPWNSVKSGKWSWTGANVLLTPANVYGSLQSDGLGFGDSDHPALFFRKN